MCNEPLSLNPLRGCSCLKETTELERNCTIEGVKVAPYLSVLLAGGHQTGHLMLGEGNLLSAEFMQRDILNLVLGSDGAGDGLCGGNGHFYDELEMPGLGVCCLEAKKRTTKNCTRALRSYALVGIFLVDTI